MSSKHRKLFVVEDEPDMAGLISAAAEIEGYEVETFLEGDTFKKSYHADVALILLDLSLPQVDGVELIRFLSDVHHPGPVILASGLDESILLSAEKLAQEQQLNCLGILRKPFRIHSLQLLLSQAKTQASERNLSQSKNTPPEKEKPLSPLKPRPVFVYDDLLQGIQKDQFIVYYQPQIDVKDQSIFGAEGLVRWLHPMHGLIAPNHFIPLMEKYDLIDDLTWIVLKQAIQQCQRWLEGPLKMKIRVSVNISAITLKSLDLPERIDQLTRQYNVDPTQIVLEITESALTQELVKSLEILTRLRIKKFNLSIDDFGTGYSSMVQLHRVPFSEIKVDRSFVMQMEKDHEAQAIVETIIMLGHKLGMTVIAEGVETEKVFNQLGPLGCDIAQGYLFAKPMPGAAFEEWLSENHALKTTLTMPHFIK